jgi:hypothetical protein
MLLLTPDDAVVAVFGRGVGRDAAVVVGAGEGRATVAELVVEVTSGCGSVSAGWVSGSVSTVAVVSVVVAAVVVSRHSGGVSVVVVVVGTSHGGGTPAGAGAARDPTATPTAAARSAAAAAEPMRHRNTGREPYEIRPRGQYFRKWPCCSKASSPAR